jgi:hemerythrin-like domain-containing protein
VIEVRYQIRLAPQRKGYAKWRCEKDAIEILVKEHDLILRDLDLLTTAAEKIVRNQNPPREFFEKAGSFTLNFTNEFHHYKEEIVMFGLLAQKHEGEIDAEIERLRNQHAALHGYMTEISQSLDAYSENAESEVRRLHRNLSEYIETLRRHIHAENKIFYPLVAKTLTSDEMAGLMEEFEKYAAKAEPDVMKIHENLIDEMGELL